MEVSHPGDGSGADPALDALQTHPSLPADDERERPRCAHLAVLATSRPYSIFKVKKTHIFHAPVCVSARGDESACRSLLPEISKGESGLIKMGAASRAALH